MIHKLLLVALLNSLFFHSSSKTFAQPDTIGVTHSATSYLLFNQPVAIVDIGIRGEYLAKIEGTCVFVKALHEKALPTTLLVKSGEEYLAARLQYDFAPPTVLHDFRQRENLSDAKAIAPAVSVPAAVLTQAAAGSVAQRIRQRVAQLSKDTKARTLRKVSRSGIRCRLTHLFHDPEATYLKLVLENHSSLPYRVEYTGIDRVEKRGKRFSVNNQHQQVVQPILQELPGPIAPGQQKTLLLALPLYALPPRGHLHIMIREKAGARTLALAIPASRINRAPFLTH